jgi:hypothetical protein
LATHLKLSQRPHWKFESIDAKEKILVEKVIFEENKREIKGKSNFAILLLKAEER